MATQISRYFGEHNRSRLIRALANQEIVRHDEGLARRLAEVVELLEVPEGDCLYLQGEPGTNSLFMVIHGKFDLLVQNTPQATIEAGKAIGEFPILDPSIAMSATVVAGSDSVVAKLSEAELDAVAVDYPAIWKNMARFIADRLRRIGEDIFLPNPRPRLFIGSSTEGREVAYEIKKGLANTSVDVIVWSDDVFKPSATAIASLSSEVDRSDFGVFVTMPDDTVTSRGKRKSAPRDNVIFEIGFFMGRLGRERALMVKPKGVDLRIPTDLLGLMLLEFSPDPEQDLLTSIKPVSDAIMKYVQDVGSLTAAELIERRR
jgi:CRP/FNR family cyclic AMP-dependent transcriptional regulator